MKLLEEKANIVELEAEVTLLMEQQKAETEAKMFELQREVARAKARAQLYEGYTKDEGMFEMKKDVINEEPNDEVRSQHLGSMKHGQFQSHSQLKGDIQR